MDADSHALSTCSGVLLAYRSRCYKGDLVDRIGSRREAGRSLISPGALLGALAGTIGDGASRVVKGVGAGLSAGIACRCV